jgi:hypothetical protein
LSISPILEEKERALAGRISVPTDLQGTVTEYRIQDEDGEKMWLPVLW